MLAGLGAESDRGIGIPGAREVLSFLRQFRRNPGDLRLGKSVVVVGAGDTAMDAARSATRCPGVEEVRVVYRRGEGEMPATREEYASAREEGIRFHFLRSPESWDQGALVSRVMELGPADASGRARPVATGATETFPANTVITAVGAEVDAKALERLGLGGDDAAVDPLTQESRIRDVFLVGDAAQGAATIVKAIASARRAVDAICAREKGSRQPAWGLPAENTARLRALRDHLTPASGPAADDRTTRAIEAQRCLGCRALCVKCVEVCPNRANTVVRVTDGFRDEAQIVHLDAFCNECGNCATFCPWEGRPYRDKLTVFATEEDFRDSTNPGFFLKGRKGMIRTGGQERPLLLDRAGTPVEGIDDKPTAALVRAIAKDHSYMLGGTP
ncbi:MAG: FAD-dependent oxidoreductase [Spirochaetia bacterium]